MAAWGGLSSGEHLPLCSPWGCRRSRCLCRARPAATVGGGGVGRVALRGWVMGGAPSTGMVVLWGRGGVVV